MRAKLLQLRLTLVTQGTITRQAPLSMGFSRQEYWSGLPFPPPGDLPDWDWTQASMSPALAADSWALVPPGKPAIVNSYTKRWGACIFLNYDFLRVYVQEWDCWVICLLLVQSLSRMDCSTPGFPVLHYFPEFAQTNVLWFGDAFQPSNSLSPTSPPALNLSQHQGLFQWLSGHMAALFLFFLGNLHTVFHSGCICYCLLLAMWSQAGNSFSLSLRLFFFKVVMIVICTSQGCCKDWFLKNFLNENLAYSILLVDES